MLSEPLRQRLEALNRGPLIDMAGVAAAPRPMPATVQASAAARSLPSPLRPGTVKSIPGLLRRGDEIENECGKHLRICLTLEELWPGGETLVAKRHQHLASQSPNAEGRIAQEADEHSGSQSTSTTRGDSESDGCRPVVRAYPQRLVLLDLETCGLSGSALFLVGVLRQINDRLAVELLLARDYSEERAVLATLWQRIDSQCVLVTFNGKSFDWPMVLDRTRRHLLFRGSRPPAPQHVDLLPAARRRWRGQFANCKLQTLEQHVCGRLRLDDIPGREIPAAYQQYVRTGCEREMDLILLHNAIDLVTMLDLAMRLAS